MTRVPYLLFALAAGLCLYAYLVYPAVLKLLSLSQRAARPARALPQLPLISIAIPVHNGAGVIAGTLERILALDYPADRRQVVVVSDASDDGTDDIVSQFANRGVELLRLPQRRGKTAAENAARAHLRGAIIVNTDASVRVHPSAVKPLVAAFADPTVAVASGRDVSVAQIGSEANAGESGYVGYEMWVRDLETRASGIVGASGCLYAIRADLHREFVPEDLSRDFATVLIARRRGLRAVSVPEAVCFVPRGASLSQEYRRKVRTMTRGLKTLWCMSELLNPVRHGMFAWMLLSHKLCRWIVPWTLVVALGALGALAPGAAWARVALLVIAGLAGLGGLGWRWLGEARISRALALPAYVVVANLAALQAWWLALSGAQTAVWEPTRRGLADMG